MNDLKQWLESRPLYLFELSNGEILLGLLKEENGQMIIRDPLSIHRNEHGSCDVGIVKYDYIKYDESVLVKKHRVNYKTRYKHFRINLAKKLFQKGVISEKEITFFAEEYGSGFSSISEFVMFLDSTQNPALN